MAQEHARRPPVEIERKFLVAHLPDELARYPCSPIEQGYLAVTADGVHVRLRRKGGARLLTVKQGYGQMRGEVEVALDEAQFEALWPLTEGRRVEKRRYRIPWGTLEIELDVFGGRHEGLYLAEIEFASEEEAAGFEAPAWFGREVTEDRRYTNAHLALDGPPGT